MKMPVLLLALFISSALALLGQAHASEPKPVFGPEVFTREVAGPDTFNASFEACDPEGTFTLVVENGDADGRRRVSSATVYVNGVPVVRQSDFSQKVSRIERPLTGVMEQNSVEVRMQSAPGSVMSVSVVGVMSCLEVHIESPADGDALSDYGTIVTGTIEAQEGSEVGVTVNGVPAEVCGPSFAALGVPLAEGENTITATATDDTGNTAEDKILVTLANPEAAPVYLSAYPTAGQAPLEVKFDASDTVMNAVTLYELDYEGDGIVDVSAQNMDDLLSVSAHTCQSEGLYFPTMTLRDADGNIFSKKIIVNVFPMPDLGKKWDGMRAALEAGDVEEAAGFMSLDSRESYKKNFATLAEKAPQALQEMADEMANIKVYKAGADYALGQFKVVEGDKVISFPVQFIKDKDGIWRVEAF